MKKFLYFAAIALLMASCSEDYTNWTEPQSNPPESEIVVVNGSVASAGLINLSEMPASTQTVQVCQNTAPRASDTAYVTNSYIVLDGVEYPITNDGFMDKDMFSDFVVEHFGRDSVVNKFTAHVLWVLDNGETATTITSEPFTVSVIPPPLMIPDLWYLAGNCIGNCRGLTQINEEHVGTSLVPMYATPGKLSQLTYVGFFQRNDRFNGRFNIIHHPGDRSEQWGTNADGEIVLNGSNAIQVPKAGYYRIDLDTDHSVLTMTPLDDFTPEVFTSITMPGEYQGWKETENPMTAVGTMFKDHNHDWIVKGLTFTQATALKFAANGAWTVNWGGSTFPVGAGVQDDDDIPVAAGTYTVFFNDILGYYYFMEEE